MHPRKRAVLVDSDSSSGKENRDATRRPEDDVVSNVVVNRRGLEKACDVSNSKKPAEVSEALVRLSKQKKRRKKEYVVDEVEKALPTFTRLTERGGYSHTNTSKSRISEANTGNTPWNFGKQRSSAVKAKIAAGVRARNSAALELKLKRLGMTEEEYITKVRLIASILLCLMRDRTEIFLSQKSCTI